MFGVLISYLPNFNVGQGSGIGNANDMDIFGIEHQHLQKRTKATLTKRFAPLHAEAE